MAPESEQSVTPTPIGDTAVSKAVVFRPVRNPLRRGVGPWAQTLGVHCATCVVPGRVSDQPRAKPGIRFCLRQAKHMKVRSTVAR